MTEEGINALSLFDGMSCGQIAFERAKVKVNQYYASEIKPHAIALTQSHYPNTIQLGNVVGVKNEGLPAIDILIGGSPCKGISRLNQKQEGLAHKESVLFWEYMRVKKEFNPKFFLLENTHGNTDARDVITKELGVKPISINSSLVSAQNRPRYYWTNIPGVTIPIDKNITTRGILDSPTGDICPTPRVEWLKRPSGIKTVKKGFAKINPFPKTSCITARGNKSWNCNYILKDGEYYLLSKRELEWLQTLPEGYCDSISYEEAYDLIGDAWTIDVIAHILSFLPYSQLQKPKRFVQLPLFTEL